MAGPFDQWVSENSHCIRQWLAPRLALLSQQLKRGIDSEYVDVFHAKQFAFFCPIRLTK